MSDRMLYLSRARFAEDFLRLEVEKREGGVGEVAHELVAAGVYPLHNSASASINSILTGVASDHNGRAERRTISVALADRITAALDRNDVWNVELADVEFVPHTGTVWTKRKVIAAAQLWNEQRGQPPFSREWARSCDAYPVHTVVRLIFGSWNEMLAEAGFAVRRPHKTPDWSKQRIAESFLAFHAEHGRWPTENEWRIPKNGESRPSARTVITHCGSWVQAREFAEQLAESALVAA